MGSKTFGNGLWAFLKSIVGLGKTRDPRPPKEDLADIQQAMKKRTPTSGTQMSDRRLLYFIMQGPSYFLNPMVHLLRYVRGTETSVKAAVLYLQDPPPEAANRTLAERVAQLCAPPPDGFGLTRARVSEALFRANIKEDPSLLPPLPGGGGGDAGGASLDGIKAASFAEEEDAELREFRNKLLASAKTDPAAKANAAASPAAAAAAAAPKVHRLATQKWTSQRGANTVKRLQKELIQMQAHGSFEVEVVKDNIFEWHVTIEGAKGSFYEGERFKLRFAFDSKYPAEPPEVSFLARVDGWALPETPTKCASGECPSQAKGSEWPLRWGTRKHHCPIHPHIYTNGNICLSIIYDDWSPALGVEAVCHSIVSMMSSAKQKEPPADNDMHLDANHASPKQVKGWDFHDNEA